MASAHLRAAEIENFGPISTVDAFEIQKRLTGGEFVRGPRGSIAVIVITPQISHCRIATAKKTFYRLAACQNFCCCERVFFRQGSALDQHRSRPRILLRQISRR